MRMKIGGYVLYAGSKYKVVKVDWLSKTVTLIDEKTDHEVTIRINSPLIKEIDDEC